MLRDTMNLMGCDYFRDVPRRRRIEAAGKYWLVSRRTTDGSTLEVLQQTITLRTVYTSMKSNYW